jgi:threonine dehydratase
MYHVYYREETSKRFAEENNYEIIPSADHYDIIAGQVSDE